MHPPEQQPVDAHTSIEQHTRRRQIALGHSLSGKLAIYLDIKFWIFFRDADRQGAHPAGSLLTLLRKIVKSGRAFCPISESVFLELLKQSDQSTRVATAELIDELSLGITLTPERERYSTEIAHLVYHNSGHKNLYPVKHLVWNKLGHTLGVLHPTSTALSPDDELNIQKVFFDYLWAIPLAEIIKHSEPENLYQTNQDDLAKSINLSNSAFSGSVRSFKQCYRDEVAGIVDLTAEVATDVITLIAEAQGIKLSTPTSEERKILGNIAKNILYHSLIKKKSTDTLRTIHILASLHAALRWNKGQQIQNNDLFDFQHAAAALAYCDGFFTDGPLQTMIKQRHLMLDRLYGCHVAASVDEATAWLQDLH